MEAKLYGYIIIRIWFTKTNVEDVLSTKSSEWTANENLPALGSGGALK